MTSYNHVTLMGNLVKDPETKKIGKKTRTDFTIAVNRYIGKDKPDSVDFFDIVSWGKLAEICNDCLEKDKKVLVDGRIQIHSYRKEGRNEWVTEIVAENMKILTSDKEVKND